MASLYKKVDYRMFALEVELQCLADKESSPEKCGMLLQLSSKIKDLRFIAMMAFIDEKEAMRAKAYAEQGLPEPHLDCIWAKRSKLQKDPE